MRAPEGHRRPHAGVGAGMDGGVRWHAILVRGEAQATVEALGRANFPCA